MKQKSTKIQNHFIDASTKSLVLEQKANLIFSNAFYWVKKVTLPIHFEFQAKPYLDAVFDGVIPSNEYSYKVIKTGKEFLIFAYEDKKLLEKIEELNIDTNKIAAVYFAQTEFENINTPLHFDNKVIALHENSVITLAKHFVTQSYPLSKHLQTYKCSKHKIALNFFQNSFLGKTQLHTIYTLLGVLVFITGLEFLTKQQELNTLTIKKDAITTKYKLPKTSIQLNSILKRFKNIDKNQKEVRIALRHILTYNFRKDATINNLSFSKKQLSLQVKDTPPQSLKRHLQKKYKNATVEAKGNLVFIEVPL